MPLAAAAAAAAAAAEDDGCRKMDLPVDFVSIVSGQFIDNSATLVIQQCLSDRQVVIICFR